MTEKKETKIPRQTSAKSFKKKLSIFFIGLLFFVSALIYLHQKGYLDRIVTVAYTMIGRPSIQPPPPAPPLSKSLPLQRLNNTVQALEEKVEQLEQNLLRLKSASDKTLSTPSHILNQKIIRVLMDFHDLRDKINQGYSFEEELHALKDFLDPNDYNQLEVFAPVGEERRKNCFKT